MEIRWDALLSRPASLSLRPMSRAAFAAAALRSSSPLFVPFQVRLFAAHPLDLTAAATGTSSNRRRKGALLRARARVRVSEAVLREEWLDSLSFPFSNDAMPMVANSDESGGDSNSGADSGSDWVVGVDPDVSGAVALLRTGSSGYSAQVFDTPHLQVLVGKRVRKRIDARSVIQLLQSFGAPLGTRAYIEQSIPFPQDGKQGWYSGGFTYGLWIGILVASGFSVVPVVSHVWKEHFDLFRSSATKDDSRNVASILFPPLDSFLKRKKDHGRAEALLIAAYGKGLQLQTELPVSWDSITDN